ncbi:hypothetical protein FIBSPDRAFT_194392 [Athelia psychrophila]|uniref:Uncharacterized protein n=1 Tax=Athelia psychrophila TaxID=1759441 RepID=A0A166SL95_9AGAM|nr:hypothetical protein FIBSPDRAFT_194392 [Fibularhizoctonia sp. CBS 109695]
MLKDRSRRSAAIILTELILEPAAARIIVESGAPKTILENLNKRDVRLADFSPEEYTEYGSLMQCLAAIVKAHAKLRKNAEDAGNRPLELFLVLHRNGARLLFRLMGENSPECRAAADALVALAQHNHDDAHITNENILREVLDGQYEEFKANLENKLQQIRNSVRSPPAGDLSTLASDVASMTMAVAVLDRADDAEQLVEIFTLLHGLWREAFDARRTNDKVANEEYEDTYGEQADLVADAIGKAIPHKNHTVREQLAGSDSKADPKRLVSLLVERLGGHSHYGTWHAIKQLAKSKILSTDINGTKEYKEDDACRKAVHDDPDLLPTLVWLSREGNNRQIIFASKCLEDLLRLGIGIRHQHTKGKMGKVRNVCRKMMLL